MGPVIFVVDSDQNVRNQAQNCLEAAGYSVFTFPDSSMLPEIIGGPATRPALIIIETSADQSSVTSQSSLELSNLASVPHIVLLDGAREENRIIALESGAADYILKPFQPRELVVRVQAILRRALVPAAQQRPAAADLVIDPWAMKLLVGGVEVSTTTLEFRLIEYLARHRGLVFSRDSLLDVVWGDTQFITPRSVDACIRRVREKIESDASRPKLLKTVRGVGYRLDAVAAWQSGPKTECDCAACRTRNGSPIFELPATRNRRSVRREPSPRKSHVRKGSSVHSFKSGPAFTTVP